VLLAGFSRGASMVWDIACRAPASARAYAPVSGAFWEPLPTACEAPVDFFHSHGWADRVVPIEGRSFRDGAVVQGDVFAGLKILRQTNGCTARQPDAAPMEATSDLWLRRWTSCLHGRLDLMLHPGGHGVPEGWVTRVLDWFEGRLAED
jgi:polyhydroxybutyrate depolymerase